MSEMPRSVTAAAAGGLARAADGRLADHPEVRLVGARSVELIGVLLHARQVLALPRPHVAAAEGEAGGGEREQGGDSAHRRTVARARRGGLDRRQAACAVAVALAAACGGGETSDVDTDLGYIDDTLEFSDRINWPGVDRANGREIPFIRGFGNGRPAAYWFLGFASRRTADSFWFCREGDELCPLDANQRLNWDRLVGHPVFTRKPGDLEFSPFWQMWRVTVPDDYEPDAIKTTETLDRLEREGVVTVAPFILDFGTVQGELIGPQEVILHCALILHGTTLAENGELLPDDSGPMLRLETTRGWHQGYRVDFVDFSPSDGVFPEADDSENRPLMPFANIYIHWRHCTGAEDADICSIPGYAYNDRRPVSERGLGQDVTGDGDANDTNNVLGAVPCERTRAEEKVYSPLWGVNMLFVEEPATQLIDSYADQMQSDVKSAETLFDNVELGVLTEPEPQTEDTSGNPVPGNEGQVFFNCPNPVPVDYVPYPCEANP